MSFTPRPNPGWIDAEGARWDYDHATSTWTKDPVPMSDTQTAPAVATVMTPEMAIDRYLRLRVKKDEITKRHKAELEPFNDALDQLEVLLLGQLDAAGIDSMKAKAGTAYKTTRTFTVVKEWSTTLQFIRDTEAWEMLEARISKTAAEEHLKTTGEEVPGTTTRREIAVNVRRGA